MGNYARTVQRKRKNFSESTTKDQKLGEPVYYFRKEPIEVGAKAKTRAEGRYYLGTLGRFGQSRT